MTKEITWNEVSSTTVAELVVGQVTRELVGDFRGTFLPMPGRNGAYFFRENRGVRKITVECFVEAASFPTTRRDAVTAVANWVDVEVQARLIISDEPGVYYEAVLTSVPEVEEWREFGVFTLEWTAYPYSYDLGLTVYPYTATASHQESWDPGLDVDVRPRITITPTNGTLTGLTLSLNGDPTLTWGGTLASGDSVSILSEEGLVLSGSPIDTEVTGSYLGALGSIDMVQVSGEFPILSANGVNALQFNALSGTATSFSIVVTYRKQYRK